MRPRPLLLALAAGAALAAVPHAAHAQLLSRIRRAAVEKAAERAAGAAGVAAAAGDAAAPPAAVPAAPVRVAITPARVDTFLLAMQPLLELARQPGGTGDRAAVERAARHATTVSRLTPAQLGLLRERIALHLLRPDHPNDLSDDERRAIDGRRADFGPFLDALRRGALPWRTWNELWPRDPWTRG